MQPPAVVEQPPFRLQALVQRRPGEGRQMIERHDVEVVALCESERLVCRVRVVFVVPEDERHIQADAVPPQVRQRLFIAAVHQVEALAHLLQVRLR